MLAEAQHADVHKVALSALLAAARCSVATGDDSGASGCSAVAATGADDGAASCSADATGDDDC